jgi:hypothetical protein
VKSPTPNPRRGRPPGKTGPATCERAYLDALRRRQLAELVAFHRQRGRVTKSSAIAEAISFHHAHLKKENPDAFR